MKPFIAKDTKKPLVVMGAYPIAEGGAIMRKSVTIEAGKDYGFDPLGDGTFRLVPSGDIVTKEERIKRLGR